MDSIKQIIDCMNLLSDNKSQPRQQKALAILELTTGFTKMGIEYGENLENLKLDNSFWESLSNDCKLKMLCGGIVWIVEKGAESLDVKS